MAGAAAGAETIFRCGNEYTDVACAHATTLVVAGAVTPEQRAEARDVARREKTLAAEMTRDRREQEALRQPARAASLSAPRTAAAPPATAAKKHAKKHDKKAASTTSATSSPPSRRRRSPAASERGESRRAAASGPDRRLGLQAPVLRPERLAATRRCAGSTGMHATGQTWTHCGSSKWPTHSVHLRGSMT